MGKKKTQGKGDVDADDCSDQSRDHTSDLAERMKGVQLDEAPLTEVQKENLEALKKLDDERQEIQKKFDEELALLKAKYQKQYEPLYQSRLNTLMKKDGAADSEPVYGTPGLPNFWLRAIGNHRQIADMIEPQDLPVLAYLEDIAAEYLEENARRSFRLIFRFSENPYFDPTTLVKTYHVEAEGSSDVLASTESTEILWKPGKDVTKKNVTKKQKNKRTKAVRKITETVDCPSFFNFFKSHEIPNEEQLDKMEEEAVEELEVMVEADYQAGVILRDKIIPNAVRWYTGESEDSDGDYDEFDEDGEAMEDDDDDEGEDEDDDEEDEKPKRGGKAGSPKKGGKGAGSGEGKKEECKQQ